MRQISPSPSPTSDGPTQRTGNGTASASGAHPVEADTESWPGRPSTLRAMAALVGRLLLHDLRMPTFVILNIIHPLVWLLLFGSLFSGVTRMAGFPTENYMAFLTPGLMVMTAFFGSAFAGMSLLMDEQHGYLDRLRTSPISSGVLMASYVLRAGIMVILQSLVILAVGWFAGAHIAGGLTGLLLVFVAVFLTGIAFGSLSNALALTLRRHDAVIGVMNFLMLPLVFTSTMMIARPAMPIWLLHLSLVNPIDWAVTIARVGFFDFNYDDLWRCLPLLALFAAGMLALAGRSYRRYQLSG
ncbi:MAG: ABC transporter permease [Alphaproteobacteria bacterium]|nr:MAG: ABC transporter permease [Alphaproteobacteria bacterium]